MDLETMQIGAWKLSCGRYKIYLASERLMRRVGIAIAELTYKTASQDDSQTLTAIGGGLRRVHRMALVRGAPHAHTRHPTEEICDHLSHSPRE